MIKSLHDHVLGGVSGLNTPSLESRQITGKKLRRKDARSRDRTQFFLRPQGKYERVRKLNAPQQRIICE